MNSQVYFENIREHIAEELKRAKESISLAVAWFTDSYLAKILIEQAQSNVDIKVILIADEINKSENGIDFKTLEINGIEIVWVNSGQISLMHHKFCIIDSISCITGSYNWTLKAKQNLENIIISHDKKLIDEYSNQFFRLYNQFNETIKIDDVFKRLKILKAILLDGSKEEVEEQSNKIKELLQLNIGDAKYAKKELLRLLDNINYSEAFKAIKSIDKFIATDWATTREVSKHLLVPFRKGRKWGLRDKFGNIAVDLKFDKIWTVTENLIAVKQNEKWGCIDRLGNTIIPFDFDSVIYLKEGIVCMRQDKREFTDFLSQLQKNHGLYSFEGKQLTPFKFRQIPRISEGVIIVEEGLGKNGFIDTTGKEIVPCIYESIGNFTDGSAEYQRNGLWGFISKEGKEIIPPKYEFACNFGEGLKRVKMNGKWSVIDLNEKTIVPNNYDHINELSDGLASVLAAVECLCFDKNRKLVKGSTKKWGFINKNNQVVIPIKYDEVKQFKNGLAITKKQNKWGIIDKMGNDVIPFNYDYINQENEIGFEVRLNEKKGYINRYNQEIIPVKYEFISNFNEGLATFKLNGKIGVIDEFGHEVIPNKYDSIGEFQLGLAKVCLKEKWGFINTKGIEVIPIKFDSADNFGVELVRVQLNGINMLYDEFGQLVENGTASYKVDDGFVRK